AGGDQAAAARRLFAGRDPPVPPRTPDPRQPRAPEYRPPSRRRRDRGGVAIFRDGVRRRPADRRVLPGRAALDSRPARAVPHGVLLYRLVANRAPYRLRGTAPHELAEAILEQEPLRPSVVVEDVAAARALAGDADTIVLKALQKQPARRYGSVEQLAQDVGRCLDGRPILARPDTVRYRTAKFITRHKGSVAAALVVAIGLIAGVVAVVWEAHVA